MGENSDIQWTTHTFNPWEGCQRVSPGCQHCYAEARNHRFAGDDASKVLWGPKAPRRRTSAANWRKPRAWNRAASEAGRRDRVFCASLADVFEDRPEIVAWRADLFDLINMTPSLDWLLLTKRPKNIRRHIDEAWAYLVANGRVPLPGAMLSEWLAGRPPANVWLGTTVEDQQRANERIPELLKVPAAVRFLSCEPLLEAVNIAPFLQRQAGAGMGSALMSTVVDWVIIGGESGGGARPFHLDWARSLVAQARQAGVAPFVKQLGAVAVDGNAWPHRTEDRLKLNDSAGGDIAEWPEDLRVREFPR